MKILLLIDSLGLGGAEADMIRLANYLYRRHELRIVLFTDVRTSPGIEDLPPDIPIQVLPTRAGRLSRWLVRAQGYRAMVKDCEACISFLTGANALAVLSGGKAPVMISVRGSRLHDPINSVREWVLAKIVDPLVYRGAEAIHSCSAGITFELSGLPARLRSKIVTIEGTANTGDLLLQAGDPIADFVPGDRPKVMACGRLHPHKGIDFFLEIFAAAKSQLPEAQLVVIGDGPDRASLLSRCHDLGLDGRWDESGTASGADVRFLGQKRVPHRYFRHAHVFVMPSRIEGLPNMLIEALASGVPILSADFPWGARQLLSGGSMASGFARPVEEPIRLEYGELLPPIDRADGRSYWVARLVEYLAVPRPFLSTKRADQAIRRFDLEQTGPQWEAVLERIAADRGATVGR